MNRKIVRDDRRLRTTAIRKVHAWVRAAFEPARTQIEAVENDGWDRGLALLPPGYVLDKSDPDVISLRRRDGTVAAHFSARGATETGIRLAAEADHSRDGTRSERAFARGLMVVPTASREEGK